MTSKTHGQTAGILEDYNFSDFNTIADNGGGDGHLLRSILSAIRINGSAVDLPHVLQQDSVAASDRLKLHPGNFFQDSLPVCDAYVLMQIHDWSDQETAQLLKAVRRSAIVPNPALPGTHVQSDDELLDYARRNGGTCYHASSTCMMGSHPTSVVDSELRMHGLDGLHVICLRLLLVRIGCNEEQTLDRPLPPLLECPCHDRLLPATNAEKAIIPSRHCTTMTDG
jgi:hypothetical protein